MTFTSVLTPAQEEEMCEMSLDGIWTINDMSVTFKVSIRTVHRILAKHSMPKTVKSVRKKRSTKKPTGPRPLKPCGTDAAYQRHRRAGEYPCPPCLEAHSLRVSPHRKKSKTKLKPCGTPAAHARHLRNKEVPCEPCREAHNERKRKK